MKGLEFDHVIVVEPVAIAATKPSGLQQLYVALTRPTQSLTVLHERVLPQALRGLPPRQHGPAVDHAELTEPTPAAAADEAPAHVEPTSQEESNVTRLLRGTPAPRLSAPPSAPARREPSPPVSFAAEAEPFGGGPEQTTGLGSTADTTPSDLIGTRSSDGDVRRAGTLRRWVRRLARREP